MKKLQPSTKGRNYQTWLLILPYLHYPKNTQIRNHADVGFRLTTIISCWAMIESFVRHALSHIAMKDFENLDLKLKYLKRKDIDESDDINLQYYLRVISKAAWGELKSISSDMDLSIKNINPDNWEFLIHMYNLRNRFVHGNEFMVGKGTESSDNDMISKDYQKALMYLEKHKLVNLKKLIDDQEISMILNKQVTDFLINMSLDTLDKFSDLYEGTSASITFNNFKIKK